MSAVQRSKQRSATGAAAYRAGQRLIDVRTGVEYDYSHRRGVAAAHLVVPGAGIDAVDRQALWAAVEKKHTRGDAVPAREVVGNLPCELDPIDRLALALRYARHFADTYGVAVDMALHLPSIKPGHDDRNHHFHMLFSSCTVRAEADGLVLTCGKKVESLDPIASKRRGGEPIAEVERATWAAMCNAALAAAGRVDVVVDHRSYERQGIEQVPQVHLGPDAHENLLLHLADPEDVVLLNRGAQWIAIERENAHLRAAQQLAATAAEAGAAHSPVVVPIRPEPPPAPDTQTVLDGVTWLYASLRRLDGSRDERRESWQILSALDRKAWTPDAPALRALLDAHPALRRQWHAEITSRAPEIRAAAHERGAERFAARAAERREAARAYLVPVPAPTTAARAPAENAEPAPVARRDIATVPLPAVRTVRDVDEAIAEAEARLQALEQRERARATAAEAYRRAQAALQTAQAGLWARLRAWAGFSAPKPVLEAQSAAQAAAEVARRQGLQGSFGALLVPPGGAAERVELQRQLTALRDERGGLVAETAAAERRTLVAIDQVIALVQRADLVVTAEMRPEWHALRALDAAGGLAGLRDRLTRDPGMAVALAHDLGVRRPEIERMERATGAAIEQSLVVLVPSPDLGRDQVMDLQAGAQASASDSPPQGLLAAVEDGPAQAWPQHWYAYIALCEQRGQIAAADRELMADWLMQQPPVRLARDTVAEYVRAQCDDDHADYGAPTM